jgi:hypothetical protein
MTIPRLPLPPDDQGIPPAFLQWANELVRTLERYIQQADRDNLTQNDAIVLVPSTVSGLNGYLTASGTYRYKPALTQNAGARLVFCSNASGGAVPVYSDGTVWRRVTDASVVT